MSKLQNGASSRGASATPAPGTPTPATGPTSLLPPVVGINFGNSYASIAVFTKEGLAESIANEDGERQIACAIAFHGEEMYIGNQAKQQLVKNAKNSIVGFRNLLGKKFSEVPGSEHPTLSAPIIQHPDLADTIAYKVEVLQPAPSPLPTSAYTTPAASHAPTPRSEPIPSTRILTVHDVTVIFLRSLLKSAEDFLGKPITGAVISVPEADTFGEKQREALKAAAKEAGLNVLQLLDEAAAVVALTTTALWSGDGEEQQEGGEPLGKDRTQLVVDLGASALSLHLVSVREGLSYVLASSHTPSVGGDKIDDKLVAFFAADFTKKTKVALKVCPATAVADQRAEAKLRLAIEHTKRTISASPGAATCSVESLKDGLDYTGAVNRMRFDMLASPIYAAVADAIGALLARAAADAHDVDEVVYVGGTGCLPGLDSRLCVQAGFREDVQTPFARGIVVGGGVGDPTTIIARGCAAQAALLDALATSDAQEDKEILAAFEAGAEANQVKATTKTLGVLFPNNLPENREVGGTWIPVVQRETALPVRRIVALDVGVEEGSKRVACEVWEVVEGIRTEKVAPPKSSDDEDDDEDDEEEEEEEVEVKHRTLAKHALLAALDGPAQLAVQTKGKGADRGRWFTRVEIQFVVGIDGDLNVELREIGGAEGLVQRVHVAA
ncbi:hypothetical protein CVT25_001487 [Psilocybe cyanescens]|uniref:Actin-like ATPase domain-containing protein n=1 Tax=Psilocybe cyanescens TaxID=93625 RepID=A0A409WNH3_PSICY|nr:hypothetical protein CVT25_001487 [Psilocybe cyanescens]